MKSLMSRFLLATVLIDVLFGHGRLEAQQTVDPQVRARLNREFAQAYPQPGSYLPDIRLQVLGRSDEDSIKHAAYGNVKLVVTASLTCPKTRQHFPALQALKKKFGDQLGITVVYIIEAHPEHDLCPYLGVVDVTDANIRDNILHRQPLTMEGRQKLASSLMELYPMDCAVLVDDMDNSAWRCLGQSPNMALVACPNGRVLHRQGWLEPVELEQEIQKALKLETARRISQEKVRKQDDQELENAELAEIVHRLSPETDSQWEFVRWLESASTERLEMLFKRYKTIVNEPLTYGAHYSRKASILILMIQRRDLEKVKLAVEAGADLNQQVQNMLPIRAAIDANSLPIVEYLLEMKVELESSPDELSLIDYAVWNGRTEIANRLAKAVGSIDIFAHCGLGNIDAVRSELQRNPSIGLKFGPKGELPISFAIVNNQFEIAKLLIEKVGFVNVGFSKAFGPIALASKQADPKYLQLLLDAGFSVKNENARALLATLDEHRYEHLCLLLAHNAKLSVSREGLKAIHLSIQRKLPTKFLSKLIEHGANVNELTIGYSDDGCGPSDPESTEETPLHIAARMLESDHIKLLLEKGALPNELDQVGLTPLAAAIMETLSNESPQGLATIEALIKGGSDRNVHDSRSQNILEHMLKIVNQPTINSARASEDEKNAPYLKPFQMESTQYRGRNGLDISKVSSSPLLEKILSLLQEGVRE